MSSSSSRAKRAATAAPALGGSSKRPRASLDGASPSSDVSNAGVSFRFVDGRIVLTSGPAVAVPVAPSLEQMLASALSAGGAPDDDALDGSDDESDSDSEDDDPLCEWELSGRYRANCMVGKGAYGWVAEGATCDDNRRVAIKKIGRVFTQGAQTAKRVLREISILRHLRHANIVSLLDLLIPSSSTAGRAPDPRFDSLFMIMDFADTDLHSILNSTLVLRRAQVRHIVYQLADALAYLHERSIIHRDLKPANVLVNRDLSVQLADFGFARFVDDASKRFTPRGVDDAAAAPSTSTSTSTSSAFDDSIDSAVNEDVFNSPGSAAHFGSGGAGSGGDDAAASRFAIERRKMVVRRSLSIHVASRHYRAPEIVVMQPNYDAAVDVWALGCIMGELLALVAPDAAPAATPAATPATGAAATAAACDAAPARDGASVPGADGDRGLSLPMDATGRLRCSFEWHEPLFPGSKGEVESPLTRFARANAKGDERNGGGARAALLADRPSSAERLEELDVILDKLGSPPVEHLGWIADAAVVAHVKGKAACPAIVWRAELPGPSRDAADLLGVMLAFAPAARPTARATMAHPYFAALPSAAAAAAAGTAAGTSGSTAAPLEAATEPAQLRESFRAVQRSLQDAASQEAQRRLIVDEVERWRRTHAKSAAAAAAAEAAAAAAGGMN